MAKSGLRANPPKWPAFKELVRHLGIVRALGVGIKLAWAEAWGAPFRESPSPANENERLSRVQLGPTVVLYRILRRRLPESRALEVTRDVVAVSGVIFMRQMLGELTQARLAREPDDAHRRAFVERKGELFFNATMRWDEVTGDKVRFTVTDCHFPRMCRDLDMPELAPVFCHVDAVYFGKLEPNVVLTRDTTIASGATSCPFSLQWREADS